MVSVSEEYTVRQDVAKRLFDVVVSLVAIVVVSPLLIVLALAVLLDSGRPVLFRQTRVGMNGRTFRLLKFRTMVVDAERLAPNVSPTDDPRVTRTGRHLRRWYLDELPQLVNVVKGDMSLVGPRPETPEFVALFTPAERRVLTVRAGIAGPSTLAFMDEAQLLADADDAVRLYEQQLLHERVQADLSYLDERSMAYDVRLLVAQVLAILRRLR
jgi:lipopolysaccharide/colanic/teichoic acid biosynthesis glycosyltransferase